MKTDIIKFYKLHGSTWTQFQTPLWCYVLYEETLSSLLENNMLATSDISQKFGNLVLF